MWIGWPPTRGRVSASAWTDRCWAWRPSAPCRPPPPSGASLEIGADLLDDIWEGRAGLPDARIYEHVAPQAVSRADKLAQVREAMRKHGADAHFISTLDDIAWLFNLRGADVDYNPVFVGHALVGLDYATLFVAEGKVDETLRAVLAADGVDVAGYAQAAEALGSLELDQTLLIDPARVTCGVFHAMNPDVPRVEAINPSTLLKSRKTEAELANVRQAMEQDGAALCEFFAWFEGALGKERITELTIDEQITAAARRPGYVVPASPPSPVSTPTAPCHYRATAESHAVIEGDGLLLIDSGGQYLGGTTDITRVVAVGAQRRPEGRLHAGAQGHDRAVARVLPARHPSPMLDAIARAPIWEGGAEYGHGTATAWAIS